MKIKNILILVITAIAGFLVAFLFGYKRNEKQIEKNNESIDEAKEVNKKADVVIDNSKETIAKAKETIAKAKKSNTTKITTVEKTVEKIKSNIDKRNTEEKDIFGGTI